MLAPGDENMSRPHPRIAARALALALVLLVGLARVPGLTAERSPERPAASASGHESRPAGAPGPFPAAAELTYRTTAVTKLAGLPITLHARTTTSWRRDGERYEMRLHMDTIDFDQSSSGKLRPDGSLVPDRYSEKRPFHSLEAVDIDWSHGRMQFGGAAAVPSPEAGAQDRLSLQFELAHMRQSQPQRFAAGSTHAVNLIGPHDVDPWTFTVTDGESVETGRGPMRAARFSARRMVGTVEETMDIWLGADLYWMPIRIRMVDRKQTVIDSVLQTAQFP